MAPTAARARDEFQAYLNENLSFGTIGSCKDGEHPFTTLEQLQSYWTGNKIKLVLGSRPYNAQSRSRIEQRYLRVFSTLVLIGQEETIDDFIRHESLEDRHLPFYFSSRQQAPQHCPLSNDDFRRFYEVQWRFCPQVFDREHLMTGAHFDDEMILPFRILEPLNCGDSSKIYKVELHEAYNHLFYRVRPPDSILPRASPDEFHPRQKAYPSGADTNVFVLKTYYTEEAKKYYDKEVFAFKRLMGRKYVENLVVFYGSWKQGDTYNILLEYANRGTLFEFFKDVPPPTSVEDITMFWTRLLDIVQALERIHELRQEDDQLVLQGIHQDIKPTNILVFSGQGESPYDVTFKIADLGLSHFKFKKDATGYVKAIDTYGAPIYSAPECCRLGILQESDISVTPAIDIWSLGCVLSEAATWAVLGTHGLDEYEHLRKKALEELRPHLTKAGYSGCFHDGTDVLPVVKDTHKKLVRERRVSDLLVEDVVDTIEMMLDPIPRDRYTANQLVRKCTQIVRKANDHSFPRPFRTDALPAQSSISRPIQGRASVAVQPWEETIPEPQTPPQVPPNQFITPALPYPQDHTPPQSPIKLAGQPDNPSRQYSSLGGDVKQTLNNMPGGMGHGLKLMHSQASALSARATEANARDNALPTSPTSNRPHSRESRQSTGSTVRFSPQLVTSPVPRLLHHMESQHDKTYRLSRTNATIFETVEQGHPGDHSSFMASPLPLASVEPLGGAKKPRYEFISIKSALQWRKSGKASSSIDVILGRLEGRDHVFLLDDSASMRPHWPEVVRVFRALAGIVKHADPDGYDVYFTNTNKSYHGKHRKELLPIIDNRMLAGECDMKAALQNIFDNFSTDFDSGAEKSRSRSRFSMLSLGSQSKKRGLSVYVLTDGVWQEGPPPVCNVQEPISLLVRKLTENRHLDTKVGIQFIRFGNSEVGRQRLRFLDDKLREAYPDIEMDIIDTTDHDGNVLKMLLGAFDRHWDGEEESIQRALQSTPRQHSVAPSNGFYSS